VVRRLVPVVVACLVLLASGCSRHHSGLPIATSKEFVDLDTITRAARDMATADGDPNPRGVAIVKATRAAVFGPESHDPTRDDETYFIRIDGDFLTCAGCDGPPGATFGPTRWLFFDYDPQRHQSIDTGYGSAPHLEEFGQVYAIDMAAGRASASAT
jgi:hypothetical protein